MQTFQRKLLVILITGLINHQLKAAHIFAVQNAREAGLANTSTALSGNSPLYINPAAMAFFDQTVAGFSCQNLFQVTELNTVFAGAIVPVSIGTFGARMGYFGTGNYNEQQFSFAYSRLLGEKISAGISCDYLISKLPSEYETAKVLTGEVGLLLQPVDKLSVGFHLSNISGSKFKKYELEGLPVVFRAGATWDEDNFLLSTQIQMDNSGNTFFSLGSEINPVENLSIRAGVSNNRQTNYSFGVGYKFSKFTSDIAFSHHPLLGFSSFVTLQFSFRNKSK